MPPGNRLQLTVDSTHAGVRLDVYLSEQLTFSRARVQKLIDDELVKMNGKPAKSSFSLRGGESLEVEIPEPQASTVAAQDIPLAIVFEDECLAVINKPAGMVVHPGAGVADNTLVNALLHHLQGRLSGISGVLRPGIVHRLDKDTSGLLVVAKDDQAHASLSGQIKEKRAHRIYMALVEGVVKPDQGLVDKPIGRHPVARKQMAVVSSGRRAVSHFQVLRRWAAYSLVRVALETGRTHQIRVHMESLGHPVVGDIVYNRKRTGSLKARHKLGLVGHALHAAYLSFTHPVTGSLLEFEADLPDDFRKLVESL